MKRSQFAQLLQERRSSIDYVNPSDKHFWPHTYLIHLDTGTWSALSFLVHSDSLQSAYDETADYCKDKGYKGLFADDDYIEELEVDATKDGKEPEAYIEDFYSRAGNEGDWFANMIAVDELKEVKK